MNKTLLVLQREYITRVKKKSFIILTLLIPFIFAAISILPAYLATMDDTQERTIAVFDESETLAGKLNDWNHIHFHFIPRMIYDDLIAKSDYSKFYAILYVPADIAEQKKAILTSSAQVPMDIKSGIDRRLEKIYEADKRAAIIRESNIPDLEQRLAAARTNIKINTIKVGASGEGKQTSTEIAMGLGYVGGFLIYMFIFMYGTMVMRGVMEEKQNRIVEVMASSVKPFNLLMGKIFGVALVGLTQIAIWIFLFSAISMIAQGVLFSTGDIDPAMAQQMLQQKGVVTQPENKAHEIMIWLRNMNFPLIIFCFIFYFIGGFLLYSSIMGAIGAAVDSEEDTQQFILPVTAPLIISMIILFNGIQNPEGPVAFWFSIIPLTSPVMMMTRIPFDPPTWQIVLSMVLLVITFIGSVWVAAKIYRTGILMYGKKITYNELWKWLRYNNS